MTILSKTRIFLFWFLSLGVALTSYRFLFLDLELSFPGMLDHIANRRLVLMVHISSAPVALALGLIQFLPRLRKARPALHRLGGRIYGLAVLTGGLSGLGLALGSLDRPAAAAGFGLLAVLWLYSTARAIWLARSRRTDAHRRWMLRSYALTFAAVTLRLELPLFFVLGAMDYAQASNYVAWLGWLPNLVIAEFYIRRR
ncbi:MAG: DUF2306 domain-containing protein, partial [Paracoccaceae bacterium]